MARAVGGSSPAGRSSRATSSALALGTGEMRLHLRKDLGEQVGQGGERQIGFAGRGLAAQHAVPGRRGRLDPGAPQRGLAGVGLALDGQRGRRGPHLPGEVANLAHLGRAHQGAANRSHPHPIAARAISPGRHGVRASLARWPGRTFNPPAGLVPGHAAAQAAAMPHGYRSRAARG